MSRLTKRNATLKASCKKNSTYDCLLEDDCITCDCNNKILEKLAHYEDLEEQGRLIELPCRVGDTVYDIIDGTVYKTTVIQFIVHGMGVACRTVSSFPCAEHFGTRVFLTKAEAEAKLAELKEGDNQ